MKNWNLRYAAEMDEQTLNRIVPTTSSEIKMNPVSMFNNYSGQNNYSAQMHLLNRPIGNLGQIMTLIGNNSRFIPNNAYMFENESTRTEWESQANEALQQHFEEEPIVFPNQDDLHHPDNHRYVLNRVKSYVANQV